MKVYGMTVSGDCWKVAQILKLTGQPFEWVESADGFRRAAPPIAYAAVAPSKKA